MVLGIALVAIIDRQLPFEYTITSRSTDVVVGFSQNPNSMKEETFLDWFVISSGIKEKEAANDVMVFFMLVQHQFDLIQTFHACKQEEGKSVVAYVLQMKGYVDQLERLGYVLPHDLTVGLILNGLTNDFAGFGLPKKAETPQVIMIKGGKISKAKNKSFNAKGKEHPAKDDACHHCKEVGHWKRNCAVYLAELLKKKKQVGSASSSGVSRSKEIETSSTPITIVIMHQFTVCNGIYEIDMHDLAPNVNYIYNVSTKRAKHNLDFTYLWHCRLAHISKKRIEKLQLEGILRSTYNESFDQCVSCLSGKMPRKSFPHRPERATDLLGIIHTDMCGPLRHVSRQGAGYFITFNDDYSRYYFYFSPENRIVVARYAEFFEKNLITQEVSGRAVDLKEIQDEDTSPSEITSEIPMEVEVVARYAEFFEKNLITQEVSGRAVDLKEIQDEDTSPSEITSEIPMEVEEVEDHSLGVLNEPASYKAAMLDSESNKWIDAMNVKIQSMIDNMVWVLVDLPPGCKTVGSKWIFKKKTDMDGIVHTYKARLVAKGYTQLYGVDYEETFSPVADSRALRILISIVAFDDYEIWKMDVKTTFLNGYLDEDIYMVQPEGEAAVILGIKIYRDRSKRFIGLGQNAYMDKILKRYKMDNSKRGHIPMQERLDLNRTQGASTPKETAVKNILKHLRNTKDMFLVYGGNPKAKLRVDCYCDAGFETDRDDKKSQTGYVFILNGGAVDWKSSKQSTTAMSATEAEYIATSEAAMEAV
nr:retrotransposon protein, putative, Ty1-copia subclass [Tanacetum cinerariifolium]